MDDHDSPLMTAKNPAQESFNEQVPLLKAAPLTVTDANFGRSDYGNRLQYSEPTFQDKPWAILWVGHCFLTMVILC